MNILRLYVPDLGENVFKSLGAMDTTTVKEVKANLASKLVGLSTVSEVDIANFSIFEVKDGKEEKLDDNKLIMAQVKKWPKKGNTPTLVFKSSDKKKLQTIQHTTNTPTKLPPAPEKILLEEDDTPAVTSVMMPVSKINASPSHSSNDLNPSPSHSSNDLNPSFSNRSIPSISSKNNVNSINNVSSPPVSNVPTPASTPKNNDALNEALLILKNFEKQWKGGKISSTHDILTALLGG